MTIKCNHCKKLFNEKEWNDIALERLLLEHYEIHRTEQIMRDNFTSIGNYKRRKL